MKYYKRVVLAVIFSMAFFSAPVSGADVAKIGILDFQEILTQSEGGQAVQAQIQKKGREMESNLRNLGKEIEALTKQLDRDSMVMSKQKRDEQAREVEIKKYDFQSMQKKYQSEFREMESKLVEKLRVDIFSIAETIGKKEGYLLIIEKMAAIYYPSSIDITDKVIKAYNSQFDGKLD